VQGISWHWIFWLNVPVGIALVPLAATRLRESFGPRPQLDVPGLLLAGAGALSLTWGLVRASAAGWTSIEVVGTLVAGGALLGAFLSWERRARSPMLPLELFRSRVFAGANAVNFFMAAGLFGVLFLMAQFLQTALGYSPLGAGLRLLPWTATPMVIAPIAGALADRYGNRPFMVAGLLLQAIGYAWIAMIVSPDVSYLELGIAFTVAGAGTSLCFPTVANAVIGSAPPAEAGVASGTSSSLRELGGVVGVSVLASIFARHGVYSSPQAFVDGFAPAIWAGGGFSAAGIVPALLAAPRRHTAGAATVAQPEPAAA
ncbi:MAG: MFS transporter, partial [Thermoleophilaceae bacterium]